MRPVMSCLVALTLLPAAIGASAGASAAPLMASGFSGGVRPGFAGRSGRLAEAGRGGFAGSRVKGWHGRLERFGPDRLGARRRHREGFGGGYGLFGWPFFGVNAAGTLDELCGSCRERPVLPSAIGIAPSPVQPPAIYVIGEAKRLGRARRTQR